MRKIAITQKTAGWILGAAMLFAGAGVRAEDAKTMTKAANAEVYVIDAKASEVSWRGSKVTGKHNGTVPIKSGQVHVSNGAATGGTIDIDMAGIKVLDLTDPDTNAKLTNHLKSDDFFGVDKNPTATFKIDEIHPMKAAKPGEPNAHIMGSLTIKGKTHPAQFPATITIKDGMATATAKDVKVDRTLYDIRYGSGKFFQNLGDKMIHDDFFVDFNVKAAKKK